MRNSKWYEQPNELGDIVVSTRVRLARNVADYPFVSRMSLEQKQELIQKVKQTLESANFSSDNPIHYIDMAALTQAQAVSLAERHVISPDFTTQREGKGLFLSEDESISIMVNEEDHLRIQVLCAGLQLHEALDMANRFDDLFDSWLTYAFDEKLGYLTSCPTNLGTGLRASVMLHLPALEQSHNMGRLINTLSKLGLTIRGTYGEGSDAKGALYQISNQVTLGLDEKTACENLKGIVMQVIDQERQLRAGYVNEAMEDQIYRALGILKYARLLSYDELMNLLSLVRLGVSNAIVPNIQIGTLNSLIINQGAASISSMADHEVKSEERDRIRAQAVRKAFA